MVKQKTAKDLKDHSANLDRMVSETGAATVHSLVSSRHRIALKAKISFPFAYLFHPYFPLALNLAYTFLSPKHSQYQTPNP